MAAIAESEHNEIVSIRDRLTLGKCLTDSRNSLRIVIPRVPFEICLDRQFPVSSERVGPLGFVSWVPAITFEGE